MAEIGNAGALDPDMFREMPDEELIAQDLVQQGAIHAISFLMQQGCTVDAASQMLESLRKNAQYIRDEATRRGKPLFEADQISAG